MQHRRLAPWLGAIVMAFILGIWGSAYSLAQTLVIGQESDVVSLDPHRQNDLRSARVIRQIYDTLVVYEEDLRLQPGLAESWEQLDELTWEFRLRRDVFFHNGEPLTAHDVKFSFDRLRDPATRSPGAFILDPIDEVTVVDDYTVHIHTSSPFAPLLAHLSHSAASILNEKAVREAGENYGTRVAVGTGPFQFVNWVSGSHLILRRNPRWWGGELKVEEVVFRSIPDETVRAIELETGGVDIAFRLDPVDQTRLASDPNISLITEDSLSTAYIGFNLQKSPLNDVRVRRAIHHAIDVDSVVEIIYEGQADRAFGPLPPRVFGAHPHLKPYDYNPDRAGQLLAEAGYPNGFRITLWTNEDPLRMQMAEVVQEDLRLVGIDVDIQVLEWGTYLQETAAGHHDMFILGWSTITADADYGLYSQFHSSQWGYAGNRTFYANPRVDELLDLGRTNSDPDIRLQAYQEAQEIIVDEAPWVFVLFLKDVSGIRSNIEGFVPSPQGEHRLYRVSKR